MEAFSPGETRLQANGPTVMLDPDATQAIGLALHELGTNAVKYGAWSTESGHVEIAWRKIDDGGLEVVWEERDGPHVIPPTAKGFGDVVINQMAAQKIGGSVSVGYPTSGLIWKLTIPAERLIHFNTAK